VTPSITAAQGSGSKRTYSYSDVLEVKVIKSLLTSGVALNRARQAVECLRNSLGADLASSSLVMSDAGSVLARDDGDLVDLLRGGQGVFNIVPWRTWSPNSRPPFVNRNSHVGEGDPFGVSDPSPIDASRHRHPSLEPVPPASSRTQ